MNTSIIVNPNAGSSHRSEAIRALAAARGWDVLETEKPRHACELAAAAARGGAERVVACGGDGTIHEVVSGLYGTGATLGIVPMGTGNDLARTLGVPVEPDAAFAALDADVRRRVDLFRVTTPEGVVLGINAAAGGYSGEVNDAVTKDMKRSWGALAYLRGAVEVLPVPEYATRIVTDAGEDTVDAVAVIVANGRHAAGGVLIGPRANPEDGLLDVAVIRRATLPELAALAARILQGSWLTDDRVVFHRTRTLAVTAEPALGFDVDGEFYGHGDYRFEIVPSALQVVVGPGYLAGPGILDLAGGG